MAEGNWWWPRGGLCFYLECQINKCLEEVLYWIFMSPVLCVIYKHLAWGEMLDCIVPIWYFGYTVVVSVVLIVEGYLLCGRCGGTCTFIVYSCDVAIGSSWTMDGCNRAIYGWEGTWFWVFSCWGCKVADCCCGVGCCDCCADCGYWNGCAVWVRLLPILVSRNRKILTALWFGEDEKKIF